MLLSIAIYLLIGVIAGLLAGLLGVGGGMVLVPAIVAVLVTQGLATEVMMQVAVGTSLACISVTAVSSVIAHHRLGGVLWPVFRRFAPGLVLGALVGAAVADSLSSIVLQRIFGVLAVLLALRMAFGSALEPVGEHRLPGAAGLAAVGGFIGFFSAIMGIGGGSFTVPFLSACRVPMRNAVGTAAAGGLPIAVAGASGFMLAGLDAPGLPPGALGYVYLPAFLSIVVASAACAPVGARLAHVLPARTLKRVFAAVLVVIGLRMAIG